MKKDPFLLGILIGIGVLILAAVIIFYARQNTQTYVSENLPDGVVHNYVLAIYNQDYLKAYGYLANLYNKPTYDEFRQFFVTRQDYPGDGGIKIGASVITNNEDATVAVSMVYGPNDPFTSGYNNVGKARLVSQGGAWKISSMPTYNLWDYSWYQIPPK